MSRPCLERSDGAAESSEVAVLPGPDDADGGVGLARSSSPVGRLSLAQPTTTAAPAKTIAMTPRMPTGKHLWTLEASIQHPRTLLCPATTMDATAPPRPAATGSRPAPTGTAGLRPTPPGPGQPGTGEPRLHLERPHRERRWRVRTGLPHADGRCDPRDARRSVGDRAVMCSTRRRIGRSVCR